MRNFKTSELVVLFMTLVIIFISEYYYIVQNNPQKAIFIGLWPPTILGLINYFNIKKRN
jgi:hypothetical protein